MHTMNTNSISSVHVKGVVLFSARAIRSSKTSKLELSIKMILNRSIISAMSIAKNKVDPANKTRVMHSR